jgi:dGTPase
MLAESLDLPVGSSLPLAYLSALACDPAHSRGRRFAEAPAPTRDAFQRDRDRIVHSSAFRRLVYKTQVFLNHEGDLFRTRLTHSLEVAQLARTMARQLGLNEDLTEAIALAHDLGHTPFGHAGSNGAERLHGRHGGFRAQPAKPARGGPPRARYPAHPGLNLSFETREGILKHCSRADALALEQTEPGGVAARFLAGGQPSLEAQLCNLADEMAYSAHDVDDGVRSGLISMEQLLQVELFAHYHQQTLAEHPGLSEKPRRVLYETIRRMLSDQVYDVINTTRQAVASAGVGSLEEARLAGPLVAFSASMKTRSGELKKFLFAQLYRHPQVMHTTGQAQQVVRELFAAYVRQPAEMPTDFAASADLHRSVADYIAGMTDRFALREHERLTGRKLL